MKIETQLIHEGQTPDAETGAVIPPIYQTSTYAQSAPGEHKGFEYSRTDNPTRRRFEAALAAAEAGKHGFAFGSGMAAATTMMHTLEKDAHVLCCDDVYGGTYRLFTKVFANLGIDFTFANLSNPQDVQKNLTDRTQLVWIESPTNPMLGLIDIKAIAEQTHDHGAKLLVDNTFASPCLQQPLTMGADVVLHSTTKYVGGHSDVVGGALVVSDDGLAENLAFLQNSIGAIPGPFDVWLAHRGLKTLAVRMDRHCENAMTLAKFLAARSEIEKVIYPGLETHPQHELARRQMKGFGGMISFQMKANLAQTKTFLSSLKHFTLAESLGGVESLIEHPAIMTHASLPKDVRNSLGITDGFVRVSVGIENIEDLKDDMVQALGTF